MTINGPGRPATRRELRQRAAELGVTWEVHALSLKQDQDLAAHAVGHEVQLTCPAPDLSPGCPECRAVHDHLRALAEEAIAAADGDPLCTVRPFEPVLRFRPGLGTLQPEIEVAIEIRRAEGVPDADRLEALCTRHVEESLVALGVKHH
jgi:hypothetical protein